MTSARKLKHRAKAFDILRAMEGMTHKGWAVSLIYDDNGNFAFGTDGFQNCRQFGEDLSISWIVKAEDFKPTIRQAWDHFKKAIG